MQNDARSVACDPGTLRARRRQDASVSWQHGVPAVLGTIPAGGSLAPQRMGCRTATARAARAGPPSAAPR
jgi:hypothetical protein